MILLHALVNHGSVYLVEVNWDGMNLLDESSMICLKELHSSSTGVIRLCVETNESTESRTYAFNLAMSALPQTDILRRVGLEYLASQSILAKAIVSWSLSPGVGEQWLTRVGLLVAKISRVLSLRVGNVTSWSRLLESRQSMTDWLIALVY